MDAWPRRRTAGGRATCGGGGPLPACTRRSCRHGAGLCPGPVLAGAVCGLATPWGGSRALACCSCCLPACSGEGTRSHRRPCNVRHARCAAVIQDRTACASYCATPDPAAMQSRRCIALPVAEQQHKEEVRHARASAGRRPQWQADNAHMDDKTDALRARAQLLWGQIVTCMKCSPCPLPCDRAWSRQIAHVCKSIRGRLAPSDAPAHRGVDLSPPPSPPAAAAQLCSVCKHHGGHPRASAPRAVLLCVFFYEKKSSPR
jgi:hypothetical protein